MPDNDAVDFGFAGQFTKHGEPHPYPDRFKEPQFINRDNKKDGVDIVMNSDSGTIMVDFGKPIQTLGLTIHDAKIMVMGLVEAITVAMIQESTKGTSH